MYYAFIPNIVTIRREFSGWTDNLFLFKKYVDLMDEYGIMNELIDCEFSNLNDCLNSIFESVRFESDCAEYQSIHEVKDICCLFSVRSRSVFDDVLVIPEHLYNVALDYSTCEYEIQYSLDELQRICSYDILNFLDNYLLPNYNEWIISLLIRFVELRLNVEAEQITIMDDGVYSERKISFEDLFDESYLCRRFIALRLHTETI